MDAPLTLWELRAELRAFALGPLREELDAFSKTMLRESPPSPSKLHPKTFFGPGDSPSPRRIPSKQNRALSKSGDVEMAWVEEPLVNLSTHHLRCTASLTNIQDDFEDVDVAKTAKQLWGKVRTSANKMRHSRAKIVPDAEPQPCEVVCSAVVPLQEAPALEAANDSVSSCEIQECRDSDDKASNGSRPAVGPRSTIKPSGSFERLRLGHTNTNAPRKGANGDNDSDEDCGEKDALSAGPAIQDQASNTGWRRVLERALYSAPFEYTCSFVILLSALAVGLETDVKAKQILEDPPQEFKHIELFFCIFFTVEVSLRLLANHKRYLWGPGWQMNLFDCIVVGLQLFELTVVVIVDAATSVNLNLFVLRMLRLIRLVRLVRTLRVLKMIGEVRAIIWSVGLSIKPLCGAITILFLMTYMTGIYFADIVCTFRATTDASHPYYEELEKYFGSLSRSILSLYEAITGGVDWDSIVEPLMSIHPMYGALFCFYIAFSLLALMNVITGVFVENALLIGKRDKDNYTVNYLRTVFDKMDYDRDGAITWEDFQAGIETGEMTELFRSIELDLSEAQCVFKLLDMNGSKTLDAVEFLNGCLRLRGPAKALDMMMMMRTMKEMIQGLAEQVEYVTEQLPMKQES